MTGPRGVRPARVELAAGTLEDLRDRIAATRAARIPPGVTGRWGIDADALAEILARWRSFDADALAQRLDAIDQVDVAFDDGTVRALHFRGEVEHATPLVVVHGWPSTVLEAIPLAERLASPSRHGGDPADAFHVVVPALPGFPLSSPAGDLDGYTGSALADRCTDVMLALGYERFGASGGDIGARVAAWVGARHPDRVLGVHVTSNALWHELPGADLSEEERSYVERLAAWDHDEGAYMHVQETKPLVLAPGLSDSPAGLAAWIGEKWQAWTGSGPDALEPLMPELLGTLTLYWATNSIATSLLPYAVAHRPPGKRPWGRDITVPVSFYLPPADIGGIPPRRFAERQYDVARWSELPRGGHFAACEEPDLLAADVRAAFAA
jgi:pimeloyl-ACP methyl ester carboxylesterase